MDGTTKTTDAGSVTIRLANRFDIAGIEVLMRGSYKHAQAELPPYDPGHCWRQLLYFMEEDQDAGRVFVADVGGEVVGILALVKEAWPWNPRIHHITNLHFFVHPKHRDTGAAVALIDRAREIAKGAGMRLWLKFMFGTDPELLDRWVAQQGFSRMGSNFLWEPK